MVSRRPLFTHTYSHLQLSKLTVRSAPGQENGFWGRTLIMYPEKSLLGAVRGQWKTRECSPGSALQNWFPNFGQILHCAQDVARVN